MVLEYRSRLGDRQATMGKAQRVPSRWKLYSRPRCETGIGEASESAAALLCKRSRRTSSGRVRALIELSSLDKAERLLRP